MDELFQPDSEGFFGLRLESIGGYGAHIAGRILAEAGILYQGLNGSNFSSYGSEKKGSPVTAHVRFCEPMQAVRTSAPVEYPRVVAVFHEALARTHPVAAGLAPGGVVIMNTRRSPAEAAALLKLGRVSVGAVDAIGIALAEGSRPNMAMLGAICRTVPFLDPEAVKGVIRETFQKKYPQSVIGNLKAFQRGYAEVAFADAGTEGLTAPPEVRQGPAYGYIEAPIGGVILNPGNTQIKDLSASRQGTLPEFVRDKCIDCAQCDLVCPDFSFAWEYEADKRGRPALVLKGIDYQYCKGCMRCVHVCPTDALLVRTETDGWADEHRVPRRTARPTLTAAAGEGDAS